MTFYFDMDGVLAKFNKSANTANPPLFNRPGQHYFLKCEPDIKAITIAQTMLAAGLDVRILSRLNGPREMLDEWRCDKTAWLKRYMPDISSEHIILTETTKDKFLNHIPERQRAAHVLIDDFNENLAMWEENGGVGVKYGNDLNNPASWYGLKLWSQWPVDVCLRRLNGLIPRNPFQWLIDQTIWFNESMCSPGTRYRGRETKS